jgi:hypothetical protein
MSQDVTIFITDRNGVKHEVLAPTDMNMNIMELIRSYELAEEGTIGVCGGMAMCASCQCYMGSVSCKREFKIRLPNSNYCKFSRFGN